MKIGAQLEAGVFVQIKWYQVLVSGIFEETMFKLSTVQKKSQLNL